MNDAAPPGRSRPAITCFDIGGSAIKGGVARDPAAIAPLGHVPTPLHDFDDFVAALSTLAGRAPAEGPVAISTTGVVDPATGVITCANIPCIDGRALAADLAARLGRPVLIANDADCFALAEAGLGVGQGHRIVFGAILGTGVGGGLVIDGRIVSGAGGFAGEWGHGPVAATRVGDPPVEIPRFPCGCGLSGCVDTVGGARGMERLHHHLHGAALPSTAIVAAWLAGDAAAERTIEVQVNLLASPLALVLNVVGADIVPVGGGLGRVPELVARLDGEVRRRILRRADRPVVVPGRIAGEAGLVGAALLALSPGGLE
ncbi:N-acetylmannosamine kinase [Rubellimicrobium mesophilum DSM 19309]|uniref:N-acetylglucosamine kinase n=1 Tax=Rubellimicrobium mesophilum DSM 19309 TaxID=442562 RepID=A0A017HIM9_9RHOB|nr:ROK family protein [Rubellimicrobium mesophilum]EYD74211.1 N-acetylmannosamine kinase [Rubellimicrobium mesophilum DSM 19309]